MTEDLPDPVAADSGGVPPLPKPAHYSTESFDLGGDLDLEARLSRPAANPDSEKPTGGDGPAAITSSGPATLAHDDLENPRNWSTRKKVLINIVLCTWVLSLTYASTAYVRASSARSLRVPTPEKPLWLTMLWDPGIFNPRT